MQHKSEFGVKIWEKIIQLEEIPGDNKITAETHFE